MSVGVKLLMVGAALAGLSGGGYVVYKKVSDFGGTKEIEDKKTKENLDNVKIKKETPPNTPGFGETGKSTEQQKPAAGGSQP